MILCCEDPSFNWAASIKSIYSTKPLLIRDFRNIASADLSLAADFNFLVGANGSGKTSVLEALYTLGHGRAFCILQSGRVIRHEQPEFVLRGRVDAREADTRATSVGLSRNRLGDNTVRILAAATAIKWRNWPNSYRCS